jgi:hypothetical protein
MMQCKFKISFDRHLGDLLILAKQCAVHNSWFHAGMTRKQATVRWLPNDSMRSIA